MRKSTIMTALAVAGLTTAAAVQADNHAGKVDEAAVKALKDMGAYLRTLSTFNVKADDTVDLVLESGQTIQLSSSIDMQVRRPNGFRADIDADRKSQSLYFDGKNFTLYGRKVGMYATVPAPGTIKDVVDLMESKYDVQMPLVDLFKWGKDAEAEADIKEAMVVGPSNQGGVMSTHYAFRQDDIDWQIWIAEGDKPLPVKYVITTTDDEARPQFSASLSWNTDAKPKDSAFTFTPGTDVYSINIVALDDAE